jgi:DNA-binding beta-propeller fold protein YncE
MNARRSWAGVAACVLALSLAACSPAETTTTVSSVTTQLPATVRADVEATPIDARVTKRLVMAGGPDWLAASAGSLWVKQDDGTVVRIDPRDSTEIASIAVAEELCQGIGADDEAVWSCTDGGVVRIDPATNKVAATVNVDKASDQGQIPVAFGRAWVLVGDGGKLAGIARDTVDVMIDLGTRCTELAASAEALWAVCPADGMALRIDPASATVTARIPGLADAQTIAVAGHVWAGFAGGLARIDAASARVTGVADAAPGFGGGLTATPDDVWVRTAGRFLRRVDAETMAVLEELHAPEGSGGSVVTAYDSVWATAYDDAVLYRITPDA